MKSSEPSALATPAERWPGVPSLVVATILSCAFLAWSCFSMLGPALARDAAPPADSVVTLTAAAAAPESESELGLVGLLVDGRPIQREDLDLDGAWRWAEGVLWGVDLREGPAAVRYRDFAAHRAR